MGQVPEGKGGKYYAPILLPLIVVVILIILSLTRWTTVATKSHELGVLKFERDRWTGQVFVSQYGAAHLTFDKSPMEAYDHDAERWIHHIANRIMRIVTIATVTWWILFVIAVIWLIIAWRRYNDWPHRRRSERQKI